MGVQEEIFTGYLKRRHSVSKLVVHLIFVTKYRRKMLDGAMIEQILESFYLLPNDWKWKYWRWMAKRIMCMY